MEQLEQLRQSTIINSCANTSLITLITPKKDISVIRDMLKTEIATARNIKNNTNRKSVICALSSIQKIFADLKTIPDNGIATFASQYI